MLIWVSFSAIGGAFHSIFLIRYERPQLCLLLHLVPFHQVNMAEVEVGPAPSLPNSTLSPSSQSPEASNSTMPTTTDLVHADASTEVTANAEIQDVAEGKKTKKIVRKKRRPARPQVDPSTVKSEPPPQTGTIFNIWYNKWSGGDREDKYLSQTHAQGRCNVAKDSGYTRADNVPGSYFCLFFSKGLCPRGQDCEYLHRLPTLFDTFNPNVDSFGRDKHADYRDDMGGVGSFMRQNRTLYVGRIHVTDDIEEVVARHFAEWGQIDRIRVLTARGVAFVTYTNEANAQFAKEAMAHQSLDHEEILNVRWATVDPNPQAQKREARKIEEQAAEAVRRALPEEFVREIEGDRGAGKRRREQGGFGLQGYTAPDDIWYSKNNALEGPGGSRAGQDQRLLEGEESTNMMIEAGSAAAAAGKQNGKSEDTGIISSSAIAALNQNSGRGATVTAATAAPKAAPSGPLVGYGSDEDSD